MINTRPSELIWKPLPAPCPIADPDWIYEDIGHGLLRVQAKDGCVLQIVRLVSPGGVAHFEGHLFVDDRSPSLVRVADGRLQFVAETLLAIHARGTGRTLEVVDA